MPLPFNPRPPAFSDRPGDWRGRLPAAATLVLAVLLAVQAARLVAVLLNPVDTGSAASAPALDAGPAPSLPTTDVFYRRGAAAAASNSALGYTLHGVRRDAGGGSAILADETGRQQSWPVGSQIAPGLVLESVGADHAVLASGGSGHRLELAPAASVLPAPPAALPATATAVPAPAAPAAAAPDADGPAATAPPRGIRVGDTGHAALLAGAGLEPGDELLAVNGRPLTPLRLLRLKDELEDQPELALEYRRDGRIRTTTFKLPR